ncbi:MAG: hypothetical protein AAFZ10_17505, partial [Pseudomonadota bacterium]
MGVTPWGPTSVRVVPPAPANGHAKGGLRFDTGGQLWTEGRRMTDRPDISGTAGTLVAVVVTH